MVYLDSLFRRFFAVILVGAVALTPAAAGAIDFADSVLPAAIDQPQINVLLRTSAGGQPIVGQTINELDPFGTPLSTINLPSYLDTGASGILFSTSTATGWSLQSATSGGQPVVYQDVGVAGSDSFNVSQPIYLGLAPYQPTVNANVENAALYTQQIGPVQTQIGPIRNGLDTLPDDLAAQLGNLQLQDLNVVGMPALSGKVMVVDARSSNQVTAALQADPSSLLDIFLTHPDDLSLKTYVYNAGTPAHPSTLDSDPGIPGTSHHVKLSYGTFDRFTTVSPAGATGPSLVHNPFIGPDPVAQFNGTSSNNAPPPVKIAYQGLSAEGSFLLDTGAGASIISKHLAEQLHVQYHAGTEGTSAAYLETLDGTRLLNQFQLTIGGIGGTSTVAGFYLDSLLLHTMEASSLLDNDPQNLKFLGAPVLVADISLKDPTIPDPLPNTLTLDGVLGMNFLVGSLDIDLQTFNIGGYSPGAFDWITFDEPNGVLGLDIPGAVPEPSTMALAGIGLAALMVLRTSRRKAAA